MKRTVIATALAATLFVTGLASAEDALFPSNNASAEVAFYTADPEANGVLLNSEMVNNSPFAATLEGIDAATYATISFDGESYAFPLAESGDNKNEVLLEVSTSDGTASYVSDTGTVSLSDVLSGLADDPQLLDDLQNSATVS